MKRAPECESEESKILRYIADLHDQIVHEQSRLNWRKVEKLQRLKQQAGEQLSRARTAQLL
jgi:hypothetical protein